MPQPIHQMRPCLRLRVRFAACVAGLAGLTLLTGPAAAIVADPRPRVCTAYSAADAVVVGKVVSRRSTGDWIIWQVEVEKRYKGEIGPAFAMYSENASARATPDLGKRNILFLRHRGVRWTAGGSDPNTGGPALARIERVVKTLANAPRASTGSLVGLVASEAGVAKAGWKVRLQRQESEAARTVTTDRNGRFAADLPPGKWSARVVRPDWTSRFSFYSYSYDNADRFTVKPGGCNDLRLEPVRL